MQNNIKSKLIESLATDPWYNLAWEEKILEEVGSGEIILYLWQNDNTVVIGRNQNAWKECNWKKLEQEGGKLARRLSGGGAVYHDLGNLNFTFVADKEVYDIDKQLQVIIDALGSLGIEAQFSGRNDLVVGDKKISGNAFYDAEQAALHHGTILFNTDFDKLTDYLQVSQEKIVSKGIDSVKSRVINLTELNSDLELDQLIAALKSNFREHYGSSQEEIKLKKNVAKIKDLYHKYSSWDWRFGSTPDFDIIFETRFEWGEIQLGLTLVNGVIQSAQVYSDAMNYKIIQDLTHHLEGCRLQLDEVLIQLGEIASDKEEKRMISDIISWLVQKGL